MMQAGANLRHACATMNITISISIAKPTYTPHHPGASSAGIAVITVSITATTAAAMPPASIHGPLVLLLNPQLNMDGRCEQWDAARPCLQ